MSRVIGPADDFYRVRLRRLDLGGDVEFDWRDDVLWRSVASQPSVEQDAWSVEVVALAATDVVTLVATYESASEAREALERLGDDLASMTKSEFEAEYIDPASPAE